MDSLRALIGKMGASGQNTALGKQGIIKLQLNAGHRILQNQGQCLRLAVRFRVGGRKTGKGRLSGGNMVRFVAEIGNAASVFLQNLNCGKPVVRGTVYPVFLPDMFQG